MDVIVKIVNQKAKSVSMIRISNDIKKSDSTEK